jgi:hypothetical protein
MGSGEGSPGVIARPSIWLAAYAPADIRGSAFGLLAASQAGGNLAASTLAGVLWTALWDDTSRTPPGQSSSPPSPTVKLQVRGYFLIPKRANFYRTSSEPLPFVGVRWRL